MLSSEPRGSEPRGPETPEIWYTKWTEPQRDRVLRTPRDPGSRDSADPEESGEASAVRLPPRAQRRRGGRAARRTGRRGEDPGGRPEPGSDDELPAGPADRAGGRVPARGP